MDKVALEKSIEVMKEEKTGLEHALLKSNETERESEKALRRAKLDLESSNESLSIMQHEHKMLSDDLKQKLDDLQSVDRKRSQLEKELFEYRPLKEKLSDIESQMMEIIQKKQKTDSETITLKGQIRDLESDVQRKSDEVKEVQARFDTLQEELRTKEKSSYQFDSVSKAKDEALSEADLK